MYDGQDWTLTLKKRFLSVDLAEVNYQTYQKLQQTRGYGLVHLGKEYRFTLQDRLCNVWILIIVDAYSKLIDVVMMTSTTSENTINTYYDTHSHLMDCLWK